MRVAERLGDGEVAAAALRLWSQPITGRKQRSAITAERNRLAGSTSVRAYSGLKESDEAEAVPRLLLQEASIYFSCEPPEYFKRYLFLMDSSMFRRELKTLEANAHTQ